MAAPHETTTYTLLIDGRDLYFEIKGAIGEEFATRIDFKKLFEAIFNILDIPRENCKIIYLNTVHTDRYRPDTRSDQLRFYSYLRKGLNFQTRLVPLEYRDNPENPTDVSVYSTYLHTEFLAALIEAMVEKNPIILLCHDNHYTPTIQTIAKEINIYLCSMLDENERIENKIPNCYRIVYFIPLDVLKNCIKD